MFFWRQDIYQYIFKLTRHFFLPVSENEDDDESVPASDESQDYSETDEASDESVLADDQSQPYSEVDTEDAQVVKRKRRRRRDTDPGV